MPTPIPRRGFLAAGAGLLGAAALGACGVSNDGAGSGAADSAGTSVAGGTAAAGKPKKGGVLRIGSLGGDKDSIDPTYSSTDIDQQRGQNLYDSLTQLSGELPYHFDEGLAESIELGAGAMSATVRLREGVEFHHGKTLASDDLIFTIQRILDPDRPGRAAKALAAVDPANIETIDDRTVKFNFKTPDSMFPKRFGSASASILPIDFDPENPVGTGPFKYDSFTAGSRSVFKRYENYWRDDGPYVDELQIISFSDDTSRTSALLAGQVDALDGIDPALLNQIGDGFQQLITKSGFYQPITMRVDLPPFNDVRVRQAFRLMVDRPAMVEQAYSGFAEVANDVPNPADPGFPSDLPQREQDIDQAKSLLKQAGVEGMTVTLTTAPENGNLVNSAEVFAQHAKAAGVTINIDNLTPSAYDAKFTEWPLTNGYWAAGIIGTTYASRFIKGAGANDSHWDDPEGLALYNQMLGMTDQGKQDELANELLTRFYDMGPDVVHTYKNNVDAYSSKLTGFEPFSSNGWSLGAWRYRLVSFV